MPKTIRKVINDLLSLQEFSRIWKKAKNCLYETSITISILVLRPLCLLSSPKKTVQKDDKQKYRRKGGPKRTRIRTGCHIICCGICDHNSEGIKGKMDGYHGYQEWIEHRQLEQDNDRIA